ncbi:MAG: hypothetical protein K9N47_20990 [Prosthecobacter sp.]|uniref:hypothetical protein n=1 Tax=Prosthecobacter sp. TaxID=1965333 RepID=UPI00261B95EF|nr:hypothetical protein [Prosthecobacter sp.]MCF7788612.1 hypothetical protein [Prosthecobacter sp.]
MGNDTANVELKLKATADTAGVQQMRSEFDGLITDLKTSVAAALSEQGASPEFIQQAVDGIDALTAKLNTAGEGSVEKFNAEIGKMVAEMQAAAEVEGKRIEQAKLRAAEQQREKQDAEDAINLTRRRREEDQLAMEQEALAARRRIAALQEEREMAKSVAQARQMSTEQRIERGVMGKGAYDPREDVERLKQVDAQTSRNIAGMRGYQGSVGDAALAFAYFADDAQYGLRGIMNNIPQLALMLGLGSGLAGVISVAAVAASFLWEKFGGAKEAAKQTEEAKQRTEELTTAINAASEAASRMFQADFDKYLAGLREATELWATQKGHISEALAYQNELAKAEQAAAQAKLEIERQNKLAGAKSDEERKQINADYDLRKADIAQSGQKEAMQRAVESQQLSENSLKARIGDAQGSKDAAQQTARNLNAANQGIVGGIGQQSDQARRERERAENGGLIKAQEDEMRQRLERQQQRRDTPMRSKKQLDEFQAEQAKIDALEKSISESYKKRDELAITKDGDREKLTTGKGVTFEGAKKDANEAAQQAAKARGDKDADKAVDHVSEAKYTAAERQLNDNADAAVAASKEALEADKKIIELKLELAALEKQGVVLKARQVAQQAEADAAEAKRVADKNAADQKADEEHLKKQKEEQARKLENDAAEMEKGGLFAGAAAKRNEAAKLRLKDDATPEEKRKLEMENAARLHDGVEKSTAYRQKKEAQDIGGKAGNLGTNLGEAGKDLKEAAEKLKDGATEKELEAVAAEIKELAPTLKQKFAGQEKLFSQILNDLKTLKSQLANSRGGSGS